MIALRATLSGQRQLPPCMNIATGAGPLQNRVWDQITTINNSGIYPVYRRITPPTLDETISLDTFKREQ